MPKPEFGRTAPFSTRFISALSANMHRYCEINSQKQMKQNLKNQLTSLHSKTIATYSSYYLIYPMGKIARIHPKKYPSEQSSAISLKTPPPPIGILGCKHRNVSVDNKFHSHTYTLTPFHMHLLAINAEPSFFNRVEIVPVAPLTDKEPSSLIC